jgi:hypothetical protein
MLACPFLIHCNSLNELKDKLSFPNYVEFVIIMLNLLSMPLFVLVIRVPDSLWSVTFLLLGSGTVKKKFTVPAYLSVGKKTLCYQIDNMKSYICLIFFLWSRVEIVRLYENVS